MIDYQDYLDNWDDHFGGENEGDFIWFSYGQQRVTPYRKMNKREFDQCISKFNEYFVQLDKMSKKNQFNEEFDRILNKMFFECELPLFC
jgi:hypothetical protein